MCECSICGHETAKGRKVCKGCDANKKAAKRKGLTPTYIQVIADRHLEANPTLKTFNFGALFKNKSHV